MYRQINPSSRQEQLLRMLFQPTGDGLFQRACEADGFRGLVAAILDARGFVIRIPDQGGDHSPEAVGFAGPEENTGANRLEEHPQGQLLRHLGRHQAVHLCSPLELLPGRPLVLGVEPQLVLRPDEDQVGEAAEEVLRGIRALATGVGAEWNSILRDGRVG